jgi:hemerythrin-like metal-binding protein
MAIIEWDDERFALGVEEMDRTHIEFIALINRMEDAEGVEFASLFDEMLEHTRAHFDHENRLMMEHGFPAISEHRGEHDRVLGEMTRFSKSIHKGLVAFGRSYIRDSLPQWFPLHAATMDSALAAHLKSGLTREERMPVSAGSYTTHPK